MSRSLLLIITLTSLLCAAHVVRAAPTVNGYLSYGSGQRFETVVFEPKLIVILGAKSGKRFLVFSGLGCKDCDINRSIYIHSPLDPPMESGEMGTRYAHPGKYYDYMDGELVETVRMFIGHCVTPKTDGVVWFSNTKMQEGGWKMRTFVAHVEGQVLVSGFSEDPAISLSVVQTAVARHVCREIAGMRFDTEP